MKIITGEKKEKESAPKAAHKASSDKYYAVVRVRGTPDSKEKTRDMLNILGLTKPNHCIIVPKNPSYDGMLIAAKDYVTWGEITEETKKKLEEKSDDEKKKLIRLHPPRKGYSKHGVKLAYTQGGALGYRKEKMNELIQRML